MTALVDTSVLVAATGGGGLGEFEEPWVVSIVTVGELEAGVLEASDAPTRTVRLALLTEVLARAPALPVEGRVAIQYAALRSATARKPSNDLWIAATALAHGYSLLTADEGQARLPGVDSLLISTLPGEGS